MFALDNLLTPPEWPTAPKKPEILRCDISLLSEEEAETLPKVIKEYTKAKEEYKEKIKEYNLLARARTDKFKDDLEVEFGTRGHPKAGKLWDAAWEHGHSSGLTDVYYYYSELSKLIVE